MKAFFKIDDDFSLMPHDDETRKYILRRKPGQIIRAEIKQSRNYENHKRFFSFINTTFHMQDHFDEQEAYRYWLTLKCGYFDTIVAPNGITMFKARSIAFDSMQEDEFRKLFSAAIDVFLKELGNGLTESQVMAAIEYD